MKDNEDIRELNFKMEELVLNTYSVKLPKSKLEIAKKAIKEDPESVFALDEIEFEIETTDYIESYYNTLKIIE